MSLGKHFFIVAGLMIPAAVSAQNPGHLKYPDARKGETVETHFGKEITDPYRWLEDPNSPETKGWVAAENALTESWLSQVAARDDIRARLTKLWDYERFGTPSKRGPWYIFARNDGLQNQAVIYKTRSLDGAAEVLIDPNGLSADGTVALGGVSFSDDGRYMAYALASSGSDWLEWRVREVETARDLPDVIKWSKFSGAAWLKDGSGFFYGRFDEPKDGEAYTGVNKFYKLYFHRLHTGQSADTLVYERKDQPDWTFAAEVTDDGRFLLIYQNEGTDPRARVFIRDLTRDDAEVQPFLDRFDADYRVVGNDGTRFYVQTDQGAPRQRLVSIDLESPAPEAWKTLIPEAPGKAVLADTQMVHDRFLTRWLVDASSRLKVFGLDGRHMRDIDLPTLGSVAEVTGERRDAEAFYSFSSFAYPTRAYRYDFSSGESTVFRSPEVSFDPASFETVQAFYQSKDGTSIPMFLTYRKGLQRTGGTPTLLYGYGGFNIALTPAFSPAIVAWLEMGGIFAQANLRGGGEYGRDWHDAGRLSHKQNVFDDFIAAAEYLISERYTSTKRLAIYGGSNGGLLVGACLTQRPDLFGAGVPVVGVLDMLRFHKFTIGWAWTSDYGDPEKQDDFETLLAYSPLHNIKPGTSYPPTLIVTSDHDDRVAPAHSFKFAAALQAAQAGPAPILIRVETKAGHGAGKPTSKIIDERTDMYAFLWRVLGMAPAAAPSAAQP
jgi:prolyl oligopeptidase